MLKFLKSFHYAAKGIYLAYKGHRNIKIQTAAFIAALILSYLLNISAVEWTIIVIISGIIIALETVNTAIEKMVDILSPEYHKEYGEIKDLMAGSVLILSITSVILGFIIFLPKILIHI